MKVLYLLETLGGSRTEQRIIREINYLSQKGHHVMLLGDKQKLHQSINKDQVIHCDFKQDLNKIIKRLESVIDSKNIDFVYLCSFLTYLPGYLFCIKKRIPYIVGLEGALHLEHWKGYEWKDDFIRDFLFNHAEKIILPSSKLGNLMTEIYPAIESKIEIKPFYFLERKPVIDINQSPHKEMILISRKDEDQKPLIKHGISFFVHYRNNVDKSVRLRLIGQGALEEYYIEKSHQLNRLLKSKCVYSHPGLKSINPVNTIILGSGKSIVKGLASGCKSAVLSREGVKAVVCEENYEVLKAHNFTGRDKNNIEFDQIVKQLNDLDAEQVKNLKQRIISSFTLDAWESRISQISYLSSFYMLDTPLNKLSSFITVSCQQNIKTSQNIQGKEQDLQKALDLGVVLKKDIELLKQDKKHLRIKYELYLMKKQRQLESLAQENLELREHNENMTGSRSWQLTYPLRAVSQFFEWGYREISQVNKRGKWIYILGDRSNNIKKQENICFGDLIKDKINYHDYLHKDKSKKRINLCLYLSSDLEKENIDIYQAAKQFTQKKYGSHKVKWHILIKSRWSESMSYKNIFEDVNVYYLDSFLPEKSHDIFILNFITNKKIDGLLVSNCENQDEGLMDDLNRFFDHLDIFNYQRLDKYFQEIKSGSSSSVSELVVNKKPILFIMPWLSVGGADKVVYNVIKNLSPEFIPIIVTTLKNTHDWHYRFLKETPHIYHLADHFGKKQVKKEEAFTFISRLIDKYNIELVHISNSDVGYKCIPKIKESYSNIKIVDLIHTHDPRGDYLNISNPYKELIDKRIVVSEFLKELLVQEYNELEAKIQVIGVGIDIKKEFSSFEQTSTPSVVSTNMVGESFVCSYIGRFTEEKRPDFFVDIAKEILEQNKSSDFTFLMAGDGPMRKRIEKMIQKNGISRRVKILGFVNNISQVLSISNVLIMPSAYEGCPVAALEAMAMGVPVVASDVRGLRHMIKHGKNGLLCNKDCPHSFWQEIEFVRNNYDKIQEMKQRARDYVSNNYDLDIVIAHYRQLYESLLNESK